MADAAAVPIGPLASWIADQRWFANSTGEALTLDASLPLTSDGAVQTFVVRDGTPGAEAVYQVPVVEAPVDDGAEGRVPGTETADVVLVDGPRSPAFVQALLTLLFD